jgi:hypothetical protein
LKLKAKGKWKLICSLVKNKADRQSVVISHLAEN